MSKWTEIYKHLDSNDIDVYSIGQHEGICEDNYVVIKENGQKGLGGNRVGYSVFDLILFCPFGRYSQVDNYKETIKKHMKELDYISPTGNETPIITDDDKKAYTTSIEYVILKRLD